MGKIVFRAGFFAVFAVFLVLTAAFFIRSPVLLVTDAPFEDLYGRGRSRVKRLELSLRLFRRLKTVEIAGDAGADLAAFAVEEALPSPYCVLFPYRYYQGARRYARRFPRIPLAVLGGRGRDGTDIPGFIPTDTEADFYRAGLCAAVLAPEGTVLVLGEPSPAERKFFLEGLRARGYEGTPQYAAGSEEITLRADCMVIAGPSSFLLTRFSRAPSVLFSWTDPGLIPRECQVIFDDSPWALAAEAVEMAVRGNFGPLPSKALVLKGRITEKGVLQSLKKAVHSIGP
ncbi:MAG: hypothetical protein LBO80_04375 [Treponema sp.]|jgi:hypothetical protein|nr:hypothetical protein [Treponema sp.]